jgi:hypothetical protein
MGKGKCRSEDSSGNFYRDEREIYSTGSDSGMSEDSGAATLMLVSTAIISARMSRMGCDMSVHLGRHREHGREILPWGRSCRRC